MRKANTCDLELSSISLQSLNSFRLPCYALSFGPACVSAFADFSTCRVPEPRRYCKIRTLGYSYRGCQTTSTQITTNTSKFLQVFLSKRLQHVLQSWRLVITAAIQGSNTSRVDAANICLLKTFLQCFRADPWHGTCQPHFSIIFLRHLRTGDVLLAVNGTLACKVCTFGAVCEWHNSANSSCFFNKGDLEANSWILRITKRSWQKTGRQMGRQSLSLG